jgi:type III secretory pathway component EscS
MNKARLDGLQVLILGSAFFVLVGAVTARINYLGMIDFREFYYGSQCLMQGHDPYNQKDLGAIYQMEVWHATPTPGSAYSLPFTVPVTPNFPTTFLLVAPLALLPWKLAATLWLMLNAGFFITAAFLIWNVGADIAPRISTLLILLLLINSEFVLALGNTVGIVVGLVVIGAWCFIRERYLPLGVACLAVALVMKPHDAGMVWLYFLLAGKSTRKRALQVFAIAATLAVAAELWTLHAAPHWIQELHANLVTDMSPGGLDNPGPSSGGNLGINMIVSLQTVLSRFWDNPGFYNSVAYLICGALLFLWIRKTLSSRYSPELAWFALAAVAPLSLLFSYHRSYDARLLLLAVPACVKLWKQGTAVGRSALWLALAAIILTGDIVWIALFETTHYAGRWVTFGLYPEPIALLAVGCFFLWIYLRSAPVSVPQQLPIAGAVLSS